MYEYEKEYKGFLLTSQGWNSGDGNVWYLIVVYDNDEFIKAQKNNKRNAVCIFKTKCLIYPQSIENVNQLKEIDKLKLIKYTKRKIDKNDLNDELKISFG